MRNRMNKVFCMSNVACIFESNLTDLMNIDLKGFYPKRIVCLTEETTELLYLLGEEDRIVGVSGFTVRPKGVRKVKPTISTFLDAKIDKIQELEPDLVIGFSDLQANIAKELIEAGITVWVNNHRSVQEILNMMVQLGTWVGKGPEVFDLVRGIQENIQEIKEKSTKWKSRPKVYFEEWYDPLISGIQWVGEIIELAGGVNVFAENSKASLAKDRIIADPTTVIERNPDIILASWCGKMFKKDRLIQRPGWDAITAVVQDDIHEIPSEIILQPGPAALMEGLPMIHQIFDEWVGR